MSEENMLVSEEVPRIGVGPGGQAVELPAEAPGTIVAPVLVAAAPVTFKRSLFTDDVAAPGEVLYSFVVALDGIEFYCDGLDAADQQLTEQRVVGIEAELRKVRELPDAGAMNARLGELVAQQAAIYDEIIGECVKGWSRAGAAWSAGRQAAMRSLAKLDLGSGIIGQSRADQGREGFLGP